MFENKKILNLSFFLLILISEFLLFVYLFSNSFVYADDTHLHHQPLKELFYSSKQGIFISAFFVKLFSVYIPFYFDLHPSFFRSTYFCYIEAIIILSFIFILNNVLFINKKINFLYTISFVFLSSFFFFIMQQQTYLLLYMYEGIFRQLIPTFLLILLIYVNLKTTNENSISQNRLLFILTFLTCIWNEFTCVTVTIGSILFLIFSIKKIDSKKKFIIKFIPIIISLCSCLILIKSGAFTRRSENLINLDYFVSILKLVPEFSISYIYNVFFKHIFMYIILFVQIAILIFKVKKDKNIKKTIKIILCYLFGILAFFCMLIGLGKIFDGDYGVTHKDLYVMYSMILCSFNLALLNLIIRYNLIKDLFIGIIMIISSIYLVKNNFFYYKDTIKFVMKPWMIEVYKAEKIIRLANLKQKTIFLDKKLFDDSYNWALFQEFNEREENTLYKESPYITYLNQFEKENKIIQCFIFTDTETVKKEFSKNGGLFTEEELNNIDFNRLKDKNFVLNYKE